MTPFSSSAKQGSAFCLCLLFGLTAASAAPGTGIQPAQLGISAAPLYPVVFQGYQDPIYAYVSNLAPTGSATLNYNVYANFPLGDGSYHYTGTVPANGGTTNSISQFLYNTSGVTPGVQSPSVTGTNTVSGGSATYATSVKVLAHATPSIGVNGTIVNLKQNNNVKFSTPTDNTGVPDLSNASLPPQEAGTEGPAGGFAPGMIGDPANDEPAGDLDLDSITNSGDSEVALVGLSPFTDLPATDSLSENVIPFNVDLFTTDVGVTYTDTFHLFYSDANDTAYPNIPGADPTGSEEVSFTVSGTLNADNTISWDLTTTAVPEPSTWAMLLGGLGMLAFYRFRARRA